MADPKQPPQAAIQAGYHLTYARKIMEEAQSHLLEALEYTLAARDEIAASGGIYYMETSPGLRLIGEAIAACHTAGAAHDVLRRLMIEHGYRPITDRDYVQYGSGGGR